MNLISRIVGSVGLALVIGCAAAEDGPTPQGEGGSADGVRAEPTADSGDAWVVDFGSYGSIPLGVRAPRSSGFVCRTTGPEAR